LYGVRSRLLHLIHKRRHFTPQDVVHLDSSQLTMDN
jgi:hypothetical protein